MFLALLTGGYRLDTAVLPGACDGGRREHGCAAGAAHGTDLPNLQGTRQICCLFEVFTANTFMEQHATFKCGSEH